MLKTKEIKNKSKEELNKILEEKRKFFLDLKFKKTLGSLKKTHLIKTTKKEIAQILTFLKQRK